MSQQPGTLNKEEEWNKTFENMGRIIREKTDRLNALEKELAAAKVDKRHYTEVMDLLAGSTAKITLGDKEGALFYLDKALKLLKAITK